MWPHSWLRQGAPRGLGCKVLARYERLCSSLRNSGEFERTGTFSPVSEWHGSWKRHGGTSLCQYIIVRVR